MQILLESNLKNIKLNQESRYRNTFSELRTKGKIVAIYPNMVSNAHSFYIKISFDKKNYPDLPKYVCRNLYKSG